MTRQRVSSPARQDAGQRRAFKDLDEAARYAVEHDVGEPGPEAELPMPRGGTVAVRLSSDSLKRLRTEASKRGSGDLAEVAAAVLSEALRR